MSWNSKKESVQKSPSIFHLSFMLQFVQKTYYLSLKAQIHAFCQLVTFIYFLINSVFLGAMQKEAKKKKSFFITYLSRVRHYSDAAVGTEDLAGSDVL